MLVTQAAVSWTAEDGCSVHRVVTRQFETTTSREALLRGTDCKLASLLLAKRIVEEARQTSAASNERALEKLRQTIGTPALDMICPLCWHCRAYAPERSGTFGLIPKNQTTTFIRQTHKDLNSQRFARSRASTGKYTSNADGGEGGQTHVNQRFMPYDQPQVSIRLVSIAGKLRQRACCRQASGTCRCGSGRASRAPRQLVHET